MSTKFWPVLHSLKKVQVHPGESSGVGLLTWRQSVQHEMGGRLLRKNVSVTKQPLTSFAGTEKKKSEASRATSLVFIATSRQSHVVWNDVTMRYFDNLWRTISIVACVQPPLTSDFAPFRFFWGEERLYTGYFDSNRWTSKGQGTVGKWTRCCVLISDFKLVIFFPGCPCPFCIVFTQ